MSTHQILVGAVVRPPPQPRKHPSPTDGSGETIAQMVGVAVVAPVKVFRLMGWAVSLTPDPPWEAAPRRWEGWLHPLRHPMAEEAGLAVVVRQPTSHKKAGSVVAVQQP